MLSCATDNACSSAQNQHVVDVVRNTLQQAGQQILCYLAADDASSSAQEQHVVDVVKNTLQQAGQQVLCYVAADDACSSAHTASLLLHLKVS